MNTRHTLAAAVTAAIAVAATFTFPAQAAPADEQLDASVQQLHNVLAQGAWQNPWMPEGTGAYAVVQPSGDLTIQAIFAGYSRALLDRGGWTNPYVSEDHYAAGEPLLAVRIGEGATTRTAAIAPARSELALLQR